MVGFALFAPLTAFYYYMVAWSLCFVAINLAMLWQPYNGLLQLFIAVGAFIGLNLTYSPHPISLLVEYGGMFFFVTATLSLFIPAVRYEYESRKVSADIFRKKANLRLEQQVAEIVRQKELLEQKSAELKRFNDQKTRPSEYFYPRNQEPGQRNSGTAGVDENSIWRCVAGRDSLHA